MLKSVAKSQSSSNKVLLFADFCSSLKILENGNLNNFSLNPENNDN